MIRKILTSSLITLVAVGGFFVNVERHENQTTKTVSYELSSIPEVHAATGDTEVNKMLNNAVVGINSILSILTVIVSPAVMLAGWLMSPDWTSGDLFGLRETMHSLWVTVSNILYFIYAVLLIVIALATMFNQEKFGYKVMLPKLALGIILVPFTWWFVQWTISLASVVTASVISIPTDTIKDRTNDWTDQRIIPKDILVTDVNNELAGAGKSGAQACAKDPSKCITPKDFLKDSSGMYGHLILYAYGVFKLNEVKNLSTGADVVKNIGQIIHQTAIAAIMFLVFGVLVIALVFILMIRAIKLWMYAIFSPLFTLHFVVGKDILGDKLDDFSLKEFIGLAFVPAVVGITLSFGLVIISAIQGNDSKLTRTPCTSDLLQGNGCEIIGIMGNPNNKIIRKVNIPETPTGITEDGFQDLITQNIINFGGITFTFKGKVTGSIDTEVSSANSTTGVISSAGGIFGTIVVDIIALIFIWAAFMAAKGVSKAVNAAVQPFEDMGKKIGQLGMSLPKYAPILPPSMGGSVAGMQRTVDLSEQAFKSKMIEHEDEMIGKTFPNLVQGIIKEADRMKAQGNIQNTNDGQVIKKELGNLLNGAKDNGTNTEKVYTTIVQADKMTKFKETIKQDSSVQTDEKLKVAFDKFMDGKIKDLNEHETKAINDYLRKSGSSGTTGAAGSTTAKIDGDKQNHIILSVGNITNQDTKVTVSNSASDIAKGIESNASLKGQFTKESLKSTLSGIISDKKKLEEIINAIKNDFYKEEKT